MRMIRFFTLISFMLTMFASASFAEDSTWSFVWDTNRSSGGEGFYNISDHSQLIQVQTLNGLEWTLNSDSHATGFTASTGQYFGSSTYPITHGTLSTSYLHGKIKSVSFEAKTKDEAQDVKITVSVGGVNYGEPVSLTTEKTVYTCTPTGEPQEGDIVFTFDQTSETKSIIYYYSMSIVYEGEGVVAPSVEKVSPELSFTLEDITIESGDYTNNTVNNPHNVSGITYSSSDNSIAVVGTNNGMVVSMGPVGTCTITATFPGNDEYEAQAVSYTLNVVEKPVIAVPEVDIKGGTFNEPVTVTITSDDPLCKAIWYSTTLTDVDDMGYDDETIIVPGKTATVTIDHTCTLLCVAVGDNNIGLPALYEFVINENEPEPTITESGIATGSFHTFYFGERELEHIGVPYEKYSDGRVVLKEFAQGNDFTVILGPADEYGRLMLDFEDLSGVGIHDVYTYPGYETWPFPVFRFVTPLSVGADEMDFIFVDGSSNYNPSYDRAVFDYHSAIDGEEYMFNIDFAVPFTDETGVKNNLVEDNNTVIYDLQGRRQEKLQHGINIVNGKKIMVE